MFAFRGANHLLVAVMRDGLGRELEEEAGAAEPQRDLEVLEAVAVEQLLEAANLEEGRPARRECADVGLAPVEQRAAFHQARDEVLEAQAFEAGERRRRVVEPKVHGTDNAEPPAVGMGAQMGAEESGDRLDVVVEDRHEVASRRAKAGVAGGASSAVLLPDRAQRERCRERPDGLARAVRGTVDHDEHLELIRRQRLGAQPFEHAQDRLTALIGRHHHRNQRRLRHRSRSGLMRRRR